MSKEFPVQSPKSIFLYVFSLISLFFALSVGIIVYFVLIQNALFSAPDVPTFDSAAAAETISAAAASVPRNELFEEAFCKIVHIYSDAMEEEEQKDNVYEDEDETEEYEDEDELERENDEEEEDDDNELEREQDDEEEDEEEEDDDDFLTCCEEEFSVRSGNDNSAVFEPGIWEGDEPSDWREASGSASDDDTAPDSQNAAADAGSGIDRPDAKMEEEPPHPTAQPSLSKMPQMRLIHTNQSYQKYEIENVFKDPDLRGELHIFGSFAGFRTDSSYFASHEDFKHFVDTYRMNMSEEYTILTADGKYMSVFIALTNKFDEQHKHNVLESVQSTGSVDITLSNIIDSYQYMVVFLYELPTESGLVIPETRNSFFSSNTRQFARPFQQSQASAVVFCDNVYDLSSLSPVHMSSEQTFAIYARTIKLPCLRKETFLLSGREHDLIVATEQERDYLETNVLVENIILCLANANPDYVHLSGRYMLIIVYPSQLPASKYFQTIRPGSLEPANGETVLRPIIKDCSPPLTFYSYMLLSPNYVANVQLVYNVFKKNKLGIYFHVDRSEYFSSPSAENFENISEWNNPICCTVKEVSMQGSSGSFVVFIRVHGHGHEGGLNREFIDKIGLELLENVKVPNAAKTLTKEWVDILKHNTTWISKNWPDKMEILISTKYE